MKTNPTPTPSTSSSLHAQRVGSTRTSGRASPVPSVTRARGSTPPAPAEDLAPPQVASASHAPLASQEASASGRNSLAIERVPQTNLETFELEILAAPDGPSRSEDLQRHARSLLDRLHPDLTPQRADEGALQRLGKSSDVWRAATTGVDGALRREAPIADGIAAVRDLVTYARAVFEPCKATLPAAASAQVERDFAEVEKFVACLEHEASTARNTVVLVANRLKSGALLLYPAAVTGQKKTVALYIGSTVKSITRDVGHGLRKTTQAPQLWEHYFNRDFINDLLSIVFSIAEHHVWLPEGRVKTAWHAVAAHPALATVTTVFALVAAAVAFHGVDMKKLMNKMVHGEWEPHLKGDKPGRFGDMARERGAEVGSSLASLQLREAASSAFLGRWHRVAAPIELPVPTRQSMEHLLDVFSIASGRVSQPGHHAPGLGYLRRQVRENLGDPSDSTNWTLARAETALDHVAQHLAVILGIDPQQKKNRELIEKAVVTGVAAAVLAPPIYFVDNFIGRVDIAANAAYVLLRMSFVTGNPNSDLSEATDLFGSQCGYSAAMIPVWGTNKGLGDPMEESWESMGVGAGTLVTLGNTVSTPLSTALGRGARWVFDPSSRGAQPVLQRPDLDAFPIRPLPQTTHAALVRREPVTDADGAERQSPSH